MGWDWLGLVLVVALVVAFVGIIAWGVIVVSDNRARAKRDKEIRLTRKSARQQEEEAIWEVFQEGRLYADGKLITDASEASALMINSRAPDFEG